MFKGKVVVVTGGGSGIGAALCEAFARSGASDVVVTDLDLSSASKVASRVDKLGSKGHAMRCNVAVEMDVRRVIVATRFNIGPIAVFCCNAGIPCNGGYEVPNDEWDRIWKVNVMQHVYAARYLFPRWIESGTGGHLVITASAAGLLCQVGGLAYSVTKHAAVSLAEWFEITYAEKNIHTHCLCPQAVKTGMLPKTFDHNDPSAANGILTPQAVADEVLQAVSDGKFMITPHKSVRKYFQRKADDYDRWVDSMKRLHGRFGKTLMQAPNFSAAKL